MTTTRSPLPMTLEPARHHHGQHLLTVEVTSADFERDLLLTDGELDQLEQLIARYRAEQAKEGSPS